MSASALAVEAKGKSRHYVPEWKAGGNRTVPAEIPKDAGPPATICPCCGGAMKGDRPVVDLQSNTVSFRGKFAKLQAQHAELIAALLDVHPRNLDSFHLAELIRIEGNEARVVKNLSTVVSRTRDELSGADVGVSIMSLYGRGYRLVF